MPIWLNRSLQLLSVINWTTHGAIVGLYYFFLVKLELVFTLQDLTLHLPTLVVLCCTVQLIYWYDYWLDAKRGSTFWHHQVVFQQRNLVTLLACAIIVCLCYFLLQLDKQVIISGLIILPLIILHQFGTYKLGLNEGWSLFYKDFFTGIIISLAIGLVSLANLNEPAFSLYYISRMLAFIAPWVWANLYLQHCFDLGGTIFKNESSDFMVRLLFGAIGRYISSDAQFSTVFISIFITSFFYIWQMHRLKSFAVFRHVPDLMLAAWLLA